MPLWVLLLSLVGLGLAGCDVRAGARKGEPHNEEGPGMAAQPSARSHAHDHQRAEQHTEAMPGPYRQRMAQAVKANAGCVACHQQEARAWRGSHHQRANLNPAYRRAFAIEPTGFCRGCHAPEANFGETPPAEVSALGVSCVTCHVAEEGVVLAAAHDDRPDALVGGAPHPLRRSRAFAHTGGCAGCHEFRFPGRSGDRDELFMQTTVREHQRSGAAERSCASCHMPLIEGRRSHAFAQVRDADWLRRNLTAEAAQRDGGLHITLAQPAPGHAFPTGDLFRRLEVGCAWLAEDGEVIAQQRRHLARHFQIIKGRPGRQLVGDDRVFFTPREVTLALPDHGGMPARVRWWVSYQRVATVGMGADPAAAHIESEVRLHAGTFNWNEAKAAQPTEQRHRTTAPAPQ